MATRFRTALVRVSESALQSSLANHESDAGNIGLAITLDR
jgi:hypothetical protein